MSGIGRLAATLILGIVLPGARAEAQNTSLMEMNMDMGCMLMAGMHEMQVSNPARRMIRAKTSRLRDPP